MTANYVVLYRTFDKSCLVLSDTTWFTMEAASEEALHLVNTDVAIQASVMQYSENTDSTQLNYCGTYNKQRQVKHNSKLR